MVIPPLVRPYTNLKPSINSSQSSPCWLDIHQCCELPARPGAERMQQEQMVRPPKPMANGDTI
jgi:hypothetical protein